MTLLLFYFWLVYWPALTYPSLSYRLDPAGKGLLSYRPRYSNLITSRRTIKTPCVDWPFSVLFSVQILGSFFSSLLPLDNRANSGS